jgi:hypothetical protein
MRNCVKLRFGIFQPLFRQMTWMQYLFVMNQISKAFMITMFKGFAAILNFVCLVRGIIYLESVVNPASDELPHLLFAYGFYKAAGLIFEMFSSVTFGHNVRRSRVVSTWQGLHLFKAALDEYLPSWLGGYKLGFESSGGRTDGIGLEERNAKTRPSTGIRINFAHKAERILYHVWYVVIMGGLVFWNAHHIAWAARSYNTMFFWLITGPLFPGLQIENLFAHLSPLVYFISPPTMPKRLDLMYVDERTGGHRPREEFRGVRFNKQMYFWEAWNLAAIAWAWVAFVIIDKGYGGFMMCVNSSAPVMFYHYVVVPHYKLFTFRIEALSAMMTPEVWLSSVPLFLILSVGVLFVDLIKEKAEEREVRAQIEAQIAAEAAMASEVAGARNIVRMSKKTVKSINVKTRNTRKGGRQNHYVPAPEDRTP